MNQPVFHGKYLICLFQIISFWWVSGPVILIPSLGSTSLLTWNFRPGKLTDFDSSLMAPSMALVARDLRFVDQNVAEPPGGKGKEDGWGRR